MTENYTLFFNFCPSQFGIYLGKSIYFQVGSSPISFKSSTY